LTVSTVVGRIGTGLRGLGGCSHRGYARTPLRLRLVAVALLLVIAALASSGAAATATMRAYLLGRVDNQLEAVAAHPIDGRDGPSGREPGRDADGGGPNAPSLPNTYVVEVTDAHGEPVYGPTGNLLDSSQPLPRLPRLTAADSVGAGDRRFTVAAVDGGGQWRVLAEPVTLADGTPGTVLVAQSLDDVQSTIGRLTVLLLVIGAGAVIILAGVGYLVVRASLRPLREMQRTAVRIAAGELSLRVPDADPRTEVGQLSGALNTMLTEIETAFAERAESEERMRRSEAAARRSEERMRRFVADASHELRTPLTSIRGFAELYRHGAATELTDVRRFMSRIENEATRMGILVEELLLLARLDQERPLARSPVDLLTLAGDAVHDAHAVDPNREISLDVGKTDPPPVVLGDEPRLRQVLANLLSNALRHTPPDAPVTVQVGSAVSSRTAARVVRLVVADHGPGMTREDAARVFERFFRVDQARTRSEGSTGLGLAIVAALVAGHGGTVDVETAPGAGARFVVELPLATVAVASRA